MRIHTVDQRSLLPASRLISSLLIQTVHKPPFLSLPGAESEFLVDMLCVHGLRIVGCVYQAVQCGRRCWSGSGACSLCMRSVSCSLDTGLQQCAVDDQLTAVYRVQSAYILAVSSVIEVWRQRAATAFSLRNSWPSRGMATTQAQVGIRACIA